MCVRSLSLVAKAAVHVYGGNKKRLQVDCTALQCTRFKVKLVRPWKTCEQILVNDTCKAVSDGGPPIHAPHLRSI